MSTNPYYSYLDRFAKKAKGSYYTISLQGDLNEIRQLIRSSKPTEESWIECFKGACQGGHCEVVKWLAETHHQMSTYEDHQELLGHGLYDASRREQVNFDIINYLLEHLN